MAKKPIRTELTPFCRGGNLYFVGTKEENCHILKTGEGLIMIDVGAEANLPYVLDGMEALGLKLRDLKIVLLSHWHWDHADGVPLLRRACRKAGGEFKVLIGRRDAGFLPFPADGVLEDGDVITLGDTAVRCVASPGHTAGTTSFFFEIETAGRRVLCGMFGGAGTNQLRRDFMEQWGVGGLMRVEYFQTLEKLSAEPVEMMVGNHSWNDKLPETYALWKERGFAEDQNPFLDPKRWPAFLARCREQLETVMAQEAKTHFVNYAHRGRSDDFPGSTMPAFLAGVRARANGIETDFRYTKDRKLILFHDKDLKSLGRPEQQVSETSFEEMNALMTGAWGEGFGPVTGEEFLKVFGPLDLRLALELKGEGVEEETFALASRYARKERVTFTSFVPERLEKMHALAPDWRLGYLVKKGEMQDGLLEDLFRRGVEEVCPNASDVTPEAVRRWHGKGFSVRAWGVPDEETMKRLVLAGVDGMTVNFPQKLTAFLEGME